MTDIDYRPLGDHETILPGDECRSDYGDWGKTECQYQTPREMGRSYRRPIPRPAPAEPVFLPVDIITLDYRFLSGGDLVLPSDMVTLDGVKMEPAPHSLVGQRVDRAKHFGVRAVMRRRDEPPQPEPAIDPGEGWRLLGDGEAIETGDQALTSRFGWATISLAEGLTRPESLWAAVRRRDPLTPDAIHRAAITDNTHDDCLPVMRFGINCVDGHRRHAASYEDACRVFDDAVRATLARRGGGA